MLERLLILTFLGLYQRETEGLKYKLIRTIFKILLVQTKQFPNVYGILLKYHSKFILQWYEI
jgi:hypothetical protein